MAVLIVASTAVPALHADAAPTPDEAGLTGEVIVRWDRSASPSDRAGVLDAFDLDVTAHFAFTGADVVAAATAADPVELAAALQRQPAVFVAEPDRAVETASDDTHFAHQWALDNTGQTVDGTSGTAGIDVDAPEAWATTSGDRDVVVAVIDSGVDIGHPDLADRIWTNPGESGSDAGGDDRATNGIDDDGNGLVDDVHGWDFLNDDATVFDDGTDDRHGTHIAGTIAATADNGIGVAGVAPGVTIMPLKFIGPDGTGAVSDAIAAIEYAAAHGARVANLSWGGSKYSSTLRSTLAAAPLFFAAAAGNDGTDNDTSPQYPSSYDLPNLVGVAAVNNRGQIASFSNTGATSVDVGAPGVDILSTVTGGYRYLGGTSMAAPHAAGVGALVASVTSDASASDLADAVTSSVQPLASLASTTSTGGMVNAAAALDALLPTPPSAPRDVAATAGDGKATVTWAAPTDDGGSTLTGNTVTITSVDGAAPTGVAGSATRSAAGSATSLAVTGLTNGATYRFTVTATNDAGDGPASSPSNAVTPAAPTDGSSSETTSGGGGGGGGGGAPAPSTSPTPIPTAETAPSDGSIETEATAGQRVTTDTSGTGATTGVPVQTAVTTPTPGTVSVHPDQHATAPADYRLLGHAVDIAAPAATADDPLVLEFHLDASIVPAGAPITVFRNGRPLTACADGSGASPDPCAAGRGYAGGDTVVTVRTSRASTWMLAVTEPEPASGPDTGGEDDAGTQPACTATASRFRDVTADNVHAPAIACAAQLGLARGATARSYAPALPVSRGQMASFLDRLLEHAGVDLPDGPDAFRDDDGSTHEQAINRLAAAGVVRGVAARRFAPDAPVSRGQMATFLLRVHEAVTGQRAPAGDDRFRDDDRTTHEASINAVADLGITSGVTARRFAPDAPVRRDQLASFLVRAVDAVGGA